MNPFSMARSLSGIYRELRQLRRMAESYFEYTGIPLPRSPAERLRDHMSQSILGLKRKLELEPEPESPMTEEELARRRVDEIMKDLSEGRDPGTEYRPWIG